MAILIGSQRSFFDENGYVVVPDIIGIDDCEAVIDALFSFLEMDRRNPEDWYREPLRRGGMVEVYQHQALWNNRQHPRLHRIFREILGAEKLWVSFDRVCMKPPRHPAHPEYEHRGFIHWDVDTTKLPVR